MLNRVALSLALSISLGGVTAAGEETPAVETAAAGSEPVVPASGWVDITAYSLEDLLTMKVSVASKSATTVRASPGVVTVLTQRDLANAGARDLIDALNLVPGLQFGVDVEGVVSIGVRGLWGQEGKVLLLIDGLEINETLYGNLQFGHHYPIDQIAKIEINRGPGSAIYGGYAELAVINVTTVSGADGNAAAASVTYGQTRKTYGQRDLSLSYRQKLDHLDGAKISVGGFIGQGQRSGREFTDFEGSSYSMQGASALDPMFLNVGAEVKGLTARFVYDNYRTTQRDALGINELDPVHTDFTSYLAEAHYDLALSDSLTLTPRLAYKRQTPWRTLNVDAYSVDGRIAERYTAGVLATWKPRTDMNVLAGVEAYRDRAWIDRADLIGIIPLFQDDTGEHRAVNFQNLAALAQLQWDTDIVDVTAGMRYERHNLYGGSFAPRLALTKIIDAFHVKLLAARAFRAPGIQNIALNPDIQPERATAFEAELGYELTKDMLLTVNAFDITVRDPIVYFNNPTANEEEYGNFGRTGSRGVEVDYRYVHTWGYAALSYSFYTAAGHNTAEQFSVPGNDQLLLGFAAHKVALNSSVTIAKHLSVSPSVVFLSPRTGYLHGDGAGAGILAKTDPTWLVNLFVLYRDLLIPGLDLGVGGYNLLADDSGYVQPYDSGHAMLPWLGREILARLSYAYRF